MEDFDTLPEELISRLNKVVHSIDEADERNSQLIASNGLDNHRKLGHNGVNDDGIKSHHSVETAVQTRQPMTPYPVDAQKLPISLGSLRAKLGAIPLTIMLWLKNTSPEPLRLRSGLQLKGGKYIKSIATSDPNNNAVCHHLYPPSEIPPQSEVVVACRSGGGWIPTSGIQGELVYTNRDETWVFNIKFCNSLAGHGRRCTVEANCILQDNIHQWQMSKDELDHKANNEFVVTISCLHGQTEANENLIGASKDMEELTYTPVTDCSVEDSFECVYNNTGVILPL